MVFVIDHFTPSGAVIGNILGPFVFLSGCKLTVNSDSAIMPATPPHASSVKVSRMLFLFFFPPHYKGVVFQNTKPASNKLSM
jgi:hypothetical protein